jgi:hypothetical protein
MKYAKKVFYGLAVLAGSALTIALSASVPVSAQAQSPNACLIITEIRNTQVTDMRTIVYRMWNGDVWRNDLAYPCPDLVQHSAGGYVQKVHTGYLCSNSQMIFTQTGSACRLGRFTRVN